MKKEKKHKQTKSKKPPAKPGIKLSAERLQKVLEAKKLLNALKKTPKEKKSEKGRAFPAEESKFTETFEMEEFSPVLKPTAAIESRKLEIMASVFSPAKKIGGGKTEDYEPGRKQNYSVKEYGFFQEIKEIKLRNEPLAPMEFGKENFREQIKMPVHRPELQKEGGDKIYVIGQKKPGEPKEEKLYKLFEGLE